MRNLLSNTHIYILFIPLFFLFACDKEKKDDGIYGTFKDLEDGRTYRTIVIGNLEWLADNLNRGEMINSSQLQTDNGEIEKYCYDNDPRNCDRLGGLYTWDEAMGYTSETGTRGICPTGWWIPTDENWKELEISLGMSNQEADQTLWRSQDVGEKLKVNGSSNFVGKYGGHWFYAENKYYSLNQLGTFWSSTYEPTHAWRRSLGAEEGGVYRTLASKQYAFSVRCVRFASSDN